ncbi:GtrA family protein [Nanchangia anserum]|uniref:GtrA family protein n=1 Tax=Nanchangia anserum TaxID=2692125 RepID=A0A8I0KQK8_9ACTO|nr:GtrA family protein [Nanchangia anserum]QOX82552.1 GtrA family protein [Nanchangia anserum]
MHLRISRIARAAWVEEVVKFCLVGGLNYVVDVALFNALLFTLLSGHPLPAKVISVAVATTMSWFINRSWTFRGRGTDRKVRELINFALVNVIGAAPALCFLWLTHHVLGLTSALADNISGNVAGLIVGSIVRYLCYKFVVFTGPTDAGTAR